VAYYSETGLAGANDEFFLSEKLERAVPLRVNGVSKAAVNCWKHGDDRAALMVVGCIIDLLADRKLRHRKLLLESSKTIGDHPRKLVNVSLIRDGPALQPQFRVAVPGLFSVKRSWKMAVLRGAEPMAVYLVRTIDDHDLVGIFNAPNFDQLVVAVDECLDPSDCEYQRMGTGGIMWESPAVPIPIPHDENAPDDPAEVDIPWNGASLTDGWWTSFYEDGRRWRAFFPDEPRKPRPSRPPRPMGP